MNIFFPRIRLKDLPLMMSCAFTGALIAGAYGIIHDQVTFSLSEEYFTKFKFQQFSYANFHWPRRVFVAEVGFLATWWVGFISGWLLSRMIVPKQQGITAFHFVLRGFSLIFAFSFFTGFLGFIFGKLSSREPDILGWQHFAVEYNIHRLNEFRLVGYIHNGSYLGGLIGLIIAIIYLRRLS